MPDPNPKPTPSPKPLKITTLVSPKSKETLKDYAEYYQIMEISRDPRPLLLVVEHGQEIRVVAGQTSKHQFIEEGDSEAETPSSKADQPPSS